MSCVFCDGNSSKTKGGGKFITKIIGIKIRVSIENSGCSYSDVYDVTDIIYCPICGEKLQKETQQ